MHCLLTSGPRKPRGTRLRVRAYTDGASRGSMRAGAQPLRPLQEPRSPNRRPEEGKGPPGAALGGKRATSWATLARRRIPRFPNGTVGLPLTAPLQTPVRLTAGRKVSRFALRVQVPGRAGEQDSRAGGGPGSVRRSVRGKGTPAYRLLGAESARKWGRGVPRHPPPGAPRRSARTRSSNGTLERLAPC